MKTRVLLSAIFLSSPVAVQALPAFYGAEGGGALSKGGRGGVVCQVTNLNDSGPGSLRACIQMSGPRTVVFRVGGTIRLTSLLEIKNPYITIAGQTAPGGGILLSGENLESTYRDFFQSSTSEVIVRYIRFRKGADLVSGSAASGIAIRSGGTESRNVIFDHISNSWATNQLTGIAARTNIPLNGVTIQHSIISESLPDNNNVSKGMIMGWDRDGMNDITTNVDLHHNFWTSNLIRMPLISLKDATFINNIVYNWRNGYATVMRGGVNFDIIGNIYKKGPNSNNEQLRFAPWCDTDYCKISGTNYNYCIERDPSIYIAGNLGVNQSSVDVDNWPFIRGWAKDLNCSPTGTHPFTLPLSYRRYTRLSRTYPVTVHHVFNDNLEEMLLNDVGASKRLDCLGNWVPNRDAVDQRLVNQYLNNTGVFPNHPNDVGGFPTIAGGTPCQDTDGDGMPDEWEIAMGLNPNDPSDRNKLHSSGYTMLEMYLNGPMTTNTIITTPANVRFVQ